MHKSLLTAAIGAALCIGATAARAQLLYSFEPTDSPNSKDGFVDNGLFPSSSVIGATQGVGSLELSETAAGGGYNGSYTQSDLPATLDDPNLVGFTADITISPTAPYSGAYSNMGMGFFIGNSTEMEYGLQYIAPTSEWPNSDFSPGTEYSVFFPLDNGIDPDTGTPEPWSTLVDNGWVATGFNIVVANNGPQQIYVDNIQAVVPEPASLGALACTGGLMLVRRRRKI